MGVDTVIRFPHRAAVRDIADVVGLLLGCKAQWVPFGIGSRYVKVLGVSTRGSVEIPECCHIVIAAPPAPVAHSFFFHFELDSGATKGMLPRSTAQNIAMGVELVRFFGGSITFSDCLGGVDRRFKSPSYVGAQDGKPWARLQEAKFAVKALSEKQIGKYRKYAAY